MDKEKVLLLSYGIIDIVFCYSGVITRNIDKIPMFCRVTKIIYRIKITIKSIVDSHVHPPRQQVPGIRFIPRTGVINSRCEKIDGINLW